MSGTLVPLVRQHFGDNFHYQDDNATPHRSRVLTDYLQQEDITKMDQHAQSTDCNPIEHLLFVFLGHFISYVAEYLVCLGGVVGWSLDMEFALVIVSTRPGDFDIVEGFSSVWSCLTSVAICLVMDIFSLVLLSFITIDLNVIILRFHGHTACGFGDWFYQSFDRFIGQVKPCGLSVAWCRVILILL